VDVLFEHRLVGLPCRLTELFVNLGMPLVNPWQQLLKARQERGEPLGLPALLKRGLKAPSRHRPRPPLGPALP
jgi:hypothetical protein